MKTYFSLALSLLLVFLSCSSSKKNNAMNSTPQKSSPAGAGSTAAFDKEGHRGCRGLMPENTIPAMLNAIGLGVTTLEMDICFSKDKKAFLSHEPFFNHEITTTPDGSFITEKEEKNYNMYNMDYSSIIKYDVGMKPHPRFPQQQKMKAIKPLLADVFEAVKKDMVTRRRPFPYFNIETKTTPATDNIFHPAPAEFVELLMKVIKENGMEDLVIIQSFDFRTLQYLHLHYATIKTAMLIEDFDKRSFEEQLTALGFTPTIYSPAYVLATEAVIKKCHDQNIKIIPWTVNDKKEIDRLKALGVDGVISDYPNLFNE
ncbi:glycerophosphodiester phosphodiesterase family protein [Ferruginibacter sp. SUN106]|uniref:glycerophosphodiester phosphodiesterase family protein n=1 Tax=Ferruginibacter sp. SUN106 TaxID=2978348 RepID=UPI003D35FC72